MYAKNHAIILYNQKSKSNFLIRKSSNIRKNITNLKT